MTTAAEAAHGQRCAAAAAAMRATTADAPPALVKPTSNLFRDRECGRRQRIDLRAFDHVLAVDAAAGRVEVEGMTTYEALVDATLAHGVMPAVVPQLKTITAGGAVAGVGIEATSFRQGLVHDTLLALDVLLADGRIVHCTPDNAASDLFFGFPNSYGTLGYALKLALRTLPVKAAVEVHHRRHANAASFFDDLARQIEGDADFVDGVVFGDDSLVLCVARFVDQAARLSDYGFERIYWRSLLEREVDHLATRDWLWRWDTDWFWCSRNFGAEHPLVRHLLGRERLNSRTYTRWMRWNVRWGLTRRLDRLRGLHPESVIQDVDIPLDRAPRFLAFLRRSIGILPIWICPLRHADAQRRFVLYPLGGDQPYVNFGFWDVVRTRQAHEPGHFNRLIEHEVGTLGGIKSLYSDSWFTPQEFARAYDLDAWQALKSRYDPAHRLLDLYAKCVRRR